MSEWIEVSPETMPAPGRRVLVHYPGRSRIIAAALFSPEIIAEEWEDSDAPPGWYEMADAAEECWRIDGVTHWQPLPAPPV